MRIPNSFVLSNDLSSFWFFTSSQYSKFCGVFFWENETMFKCIESIEVDSKIQNSFCTRRSLLNKREGVTEKLSLAKDFNGIKQELSKEREITINLDIRKDNDFSENQRIYTIYEREIDEDKKIIIVKFRKDRDKELYVAIYSDSKTFIKLENFRKSIYDYDKFRNSLYERYIYEAIRIKTDKLSIGFSSSETVAIDNAIQAYDLDYNETFLEYENPIDKAKYEVELNMKKLISNRGISAGYPWFYQVWTRDEMISIIYLIKSKKYQKVKKFFEKFMDEEYIKGFPAILPNEGIPSADGSGWVFKRFSDFIDSLIEDKQLENIYNRIELDKIINFLKKRANFVKKNNMKNGLVYSGFNETWMDTSVDDDGREGFCLEIQALTAKMFSCVYMLTGISEYKKEELNLKRKIKENFFSQGSICDHINKFGEKCWEVRPNFFIAFYVYPQLFSKEIWEDIFDNNIPKIWLEWGGFSSIEKKSSSFIENYTGENNKSYHRGDSWFFINCMAATCMIKINKEKYLDKIEKIISSCIEEINSNGVIGGLAEISSAKKLTGYGCLTQAWSNALFLELLDTI